MENAQRGPAVLGRMLRQEVLVAGLEGREVRAGEIHPFRRRAGPLEHIGREHAVRSDLGHVFEAGHFCRLRGDEAALGDEDRIVDHLRIRGRDGRQDRLHVGRAFGDGLLNGDGAAELLEFVHEHLLQGLGIGAAVVDGRRGRQLEFIVDELGHRLALEGVAVRRAQVAGIRRVAVRKGERRAGVGWRDGGQARVVEGLDAADGLVGAGRADQPDQRGVSGQLLRRGRAAFRGA